MKVLALVLMVVAAAQARSTGVKSAGALAELGANPWVVHLRVAVSSSGFLNSCAGSLINERWVLTTASCLQGSTFIWVRYGVVDVFRPSLVTETNQVRIHAGFDAATGANDIALINLNRHVLEPPNPNIAPVALATADDAVPESGTFCSFGATESGAAGELLSCIELSLAAQEDDSIVGQSDEGQATSFDRGSPLVADGVQYGILVQAGSDDTAGVFLNPANYRTWIESQTGIAL